VYMKHRPTDGFVAVAAVAFAVKNGAEAVAKWAAAIKTAAFSVAIVPVTVAAVVFSVAKVAVAVVTAAFSTATGTFAVVKVAFAVVTAAFAVDSGAKTVGNGRDLGRFCTRRAVNQHRKALTNNDLQGLAVSIHCSLAFAPGDGSTLGQSFRFVDQLPLHRLRVER
jgi:hypothetical protein